jgi:RNA polymerase sigma-70 factor, ECF subfamily
MGAFIFLCVDGCKKSETALLFRRVWIPDFFFGDLVTFYCSVTIICNRRYLKELLNFTETQSLPRLEEFTGLVRETQSSVRAFIRSIGAKADAVDDIAQEAYIVAFKKFDEFDSSKASFKTWMFGIVRFLFLNDSRKEARRSRLRNMLIGDILMEVEEPFKEASTSELAALNSCLESLDDDARELIQQRYAHKKKSQALAEETGRKPEAVRQQLLRLRGLLKKCVSEKLI